MQFYILKNHKQEGPLEAEQLNNLLRSGQITNTDLGWREGLPNWQPLSAFYRMDAVGSTPPPIPTAQPGKTPNLPQTEPSQINVSDKSREPTTTKINPLAIALGICIWVVGCAFWSSGLIEIRETGNFGAGLPLFVPACVCCGILRLKFFGFSWGAIHAMWGAAYVIMRIAHNLG